MVAVSQLSDLLSLGVSLDLSFFRFLLCAKEK